jgi:hypothetical protein
VWCAHSVDGFFDGHVYSVDQSGKFFFVCKFSASDIIAWYCRYGSEIVFRVRIRIDFFVAHCAKEKYISDVLFTDSFIRFVLQNRFLRVTSFRNGYWFIVICEQGSHHYNASVHCFWLFGDCIVSIVVVIVQNHSVVCWLYCPQISKDWLQGIDTPQ